jgi:hypothetical protein
LWRPNLVFLMKFRPEQVPAAGLDDGSDPTGALAG